MDRHKDIAKPMAYLIVIAGCMVALLTAMGQLPSGAYKLSWAFLMLGIIPYVVYGSLTESLERGPLMVSGIALLLADITARFGARLTHTVNADELPALYLCLILTLIVIPAGIALGKLVSRLSP